MRSTSMSNNMPFKYSLASGNDIYHYPYEAGGGNIASIINETQNFGFGNFDHSSWWIYPANTQCIGNTNFYDDDKDEWAHYAEYGVDNPGILLVLRPDPIHHPYDNK